MAEEIALVIEIDNLFKLFHKRLIRILEAVDSAIILVDKNGILNYVNHHFEQLFEISTLDIIGKSISSLPGPWIPYIKSFTDRRVEGKVEVLSLNQKPVCVDWQVSPLKEEESVQGWVIFINNRTDYYSWKEAVRKAERLAITAGLVGSLAHELRNPLSAAKALLQVTRKKGEPYRTGSYIDLIEREIDRVTRLLNEFLLLGKPAEKKDEPVQLALLLRELIPLLESEANNYGAELTMDLRSESLVQADPGQLTQVIMNLIRNAAQAAGEQGKIFVSLHQEDKNAVLSIKDTGPGINPDKKDQLFRPFFTTKERGTGLGLPVVQAIIHNHGGEVTAHNANEGGAVFQIVLPSFIDGRAAKPDVLIVVKDIMIKYPLEQAVKEPGLNIMTTDKLQQAMVLLREFKPQILLVENSLLEDTENYILLQQNTDVKVIIIGEPDGAGFDKAIFIPRPLNYSRLVSQLKLLL